VIYCFDGVGSPYTYRLVGCRSDRHKPPEGYVAVEDAAMAVLDS